MVIAWFDSKEVEAFAILLANDFCQRVPISTLKESDRRAKRRLNDAIHVIVQRVDKFITNRNFNLYKKSCFGNKFKWVLKEAEYPDDVIDLVVLYVVERFYGR